MTAEPDTYAQFREAVTMTAGDLEKWLGTDHAKEVGQKSDGGESVGHESGRRIVTRRTRPPARR
jgi:hypothetical protein